MLSEACPGQAARTWDLLRAMLGEGFESINRRLHSDLCNLIGSA
jgi:hypothetical protein